MGLIVMVIGLFSFAVAMGHQWYFVVPVLLVGLLIDFMDI